MTTKEALEKIRAMFNAEALKPAGMTEAGRPTDYPLADGTTLTVDGPLATGAKCVLKDASGTPALAPDGDYQLQDGTIVNVAAGVIKTITPPDGTDADSSTQTSGNPNTGKGSNATDSQTDMRKLKDDFAKITAAFTTLKRELDAFKTADKLFKEKVEEGFRLVAKLPAAEPTEKPKNTFRSEQRNYEQLRLKNISQALSQLK